jgi:ankyrin repeat protein
MTDSGRPGQGDGQGQKKFGKGKAEVEKKSTPGVANIASAASVFKKFGKGKSPLASSMELSSGGEDKSGGESQEEVNKGDHPLLVNLIRRRRARKKEEEDRNKATLQPPDDTRGKSTPDNANIALAAGVFKKFGRGKADAEKKSTPGIANIALAARGKAEAEKKSTPGIANIALAAGVFKKFGKGEEKKPTGMKAMMARLSPASSMELSSGGEDQSGGESQEEVNKGDHTLLVNLIRRRRARKKEEEDRNKAALQPPETDGNTSMDEGIKSEHSLLLNVIRKRQARKKREAEQKDGEKKVGEKKVATSSSAFKPDSLFGPEVKLAKGKQGYSPSTPSRSKSEPRKGNRQSLSLRREASSSALSGYSTESTDLGRTNSGSEGGIRAVLEKANRRKAEVKAGGKMPSDVRDMLMVPGSKDGASPKRKLSSSPKRKQIQSLKAPETPVRETKKELKAAKAMPPTVKEKFEEEAKRTAIANYLASPRRTGMVDKALTAITPARAPEEPEPAGGFGFGGGMLAKLKLTDVILAAAAAKAVKMKSREEVPPPTLEEQAERQCRRLLILCQRGEWDSAGETLKALDVMVAQETMDRKILTETADRVTGNTPLMYATIENRISFMERMLSLGCNVNTKNKEDYTALHFGSMYSREDTVNWLLAKRANPNLKGGPMKQTCVHLACARQSGQSAQVVKILLNNSSKEIRFSEDLASGFPLFTAIEAGNANVARELLSKDPEKQLNHRKKPLNDTPMHLAARRKDGNMAKVLIEAGAQVDLQNGEGQTVLHLASIMGDEATVRVLFMARANPNIQDNEDRAAIHLAAERGYSNIVEFLVEKFKASIYERTRDGSTLMHIAAINGHPETAMILFDRGVPLLMPNKFGARGIHTAAREGHVGVINSLIKKGESVDSKTGDNMTALHISVEVSHSTCSG